MNPLLTAINLLGGLTATGAHLGVSKGVVFQWKARGKVPAEYCPSIERLTNGKVKCEQLNDKVDWSYIRSGSKRKASSAK